MPVPGSVAGPGNAPTQFSASYQPANAAHKKEARKRRTRAAITICREAEIMEKLRDTALVLYGMLARRQSSAKTEAQMLEFATDDSNVLLARETVNALNKCAAYGYPKLKHIDHVGDAPGSVTQVNNKIVVALNLGNTPAMDAKEVENAAKTIDALTDGMDQ